MARIFKFVHSETVDVARFDRDFLEEFPEEERLAPDFLPAEEESTEVEEELPIDPEVLREEIMAAAREEAAQKVQEAYQEGLARGIQAGQERFEASLAHCTETLEAAATAIQNTHAQFLDSLEPQVLALVKLMVSRIIDTERKSNPELVQAMARKALAQLAGQFSVTLLVHPDDLDALKRHEVSLLDNVPGVDNLHLQASETVAPGGCIAQSSDMEIDARLETLLDQVLDALTE